MRAIPIRISPDDENFEPPIVISSAHQRPRKVDHPSLFNRVSPTTPSSTTVFTGLIQNASSLDDSVIAVENSSSIIETSPLSESSNVFLRLSPGSWSSWNSSQQINTSAHNQTIYHTVGKAMIDVSSTNRSRSDEVISSVIPNKKNSTQPPASTSSIDINSALIQPLTLLIMSYLTSRATSLVNNSSDRTGTSHGPIERIIKNPETESRTIASWIGNLAKRLRRNRPPSSRRNQNGPHAHHDMSSGNNYIVPIPYESVPHVSMNSHGQPPSSPPSSSGIFSNLIPQPEGFPGPLNPDSILLPPDVVENSGIKYWLDLIERSNGEDFPPAYQTAGSDQDDSFNFLRRPIHRNRPPIRSNKPRRRPLDLPQLTFNEMVGPSGGRGPNSNPSSMMANNNNDGDDDGDDNDEFGTNRNDKPPVHKTNHHEVAPRCDKFTSHICVDDFEYPEQAIVDEIFKRRDIFELMYSEVKGDAPLVDGIPREVEESYSYDNTVNPHDGNGLDNRIDLSKDSAASNHKNSPTHYSDNNRERGPGFICPSEVLYGRPKLAKNMKGDWKVIVNAGEFTQTVRMEKCLKPNDPCNYVRSSEVASRCAQVHSFHRLMVFEKGKGFYIDTFRIPTACSCHISRQIGLRPMNDMVDPHHMTKTPGPAQFSNTLWSILGGSNGPGGIPTDASHGGGEPGSPFSALDNVNSINSDLLKTQLNVLDTLKNYPQLSGHISPDNVFHHLTSNEGLPNMNTFSDKAFSASSTSNENDNINDRVGGPSNYPHTNTTPENIIKGSSGNVGASGGVGGGGGGGRGSPSNPVSIGGGSNESPVEYLLPGMMYAEEPLSFPPPDAENGHFGSVGFGSSSSGAPLVQVIHVPVSTHPMVPRIQQHQLQQYPMFKQYGVDQYGEDMGKSGGSFAGSNSQSNTAEAESLRAEQPGKSNYQSGVIIEEVRSPERGDINRKADSLHRNGIIVPRQNGTSGESSELDLTMATLPPSPSSIPSSFSIPDHSQVDLTYESMLNNASTYGKRDKGEGSSPQGMNFSYHPILDYIPKPESQPEEYSKSN